MAPKKPETEDEDEAITVTPATIADLTSDAPADAALQVEPGPAAGAHAAKRFRVNHTMVGPWPMGTVVKASELHGDANIARLLETGAISPED